MPPTKARRSETVTPEVLTLTEAASYLRVSEEVLDRMATEQAVPARKIGEEWRFLRRALRGWLQHGPPRENGRLLSLEAAQLRLLLRELERRLLTDTAAPAGPAHKPGSKEQVLATAGIWKDDPTAEKMVEEIYARRGRPITEDGE